MELNSNNDSADITLQEKETLRVENETVYFDSRFAFLRDHKGLRPGKTHLLLSTTGVGKSTLFRSILTDCAKKSPILFYSSEESLDDTRYLFSLREVHKDTLKNIKLLDERLALKKYKNDRRGFLAWLATNIVKNKCKALFFDNITTSTFYTNEPQGQIDFYDALTSLAFDLNIPLVLIAHTRAGIKDDQNDLISPDDIRGSKHPSIKSEYLYIFQRFKIEGALGIEEFFPVVRVLKSRMHGNSYNIYQLSFDKYAKDYIHDKKIEFSAFNEAYQGRLRLKKR